MHRLLRAAVAISMTITLGATNTAAASSAKWRIPKGAVYLDDNSDWWSPAREEEEAKPQLRRWTQLANKSPHSGDVDRFYVLGVSLDTKGGVDWLQSIERRFGTAKIVERGDCASGREQLCYRSSSNGGKVKLVFEHNEIDYSFFLFDDGEEWKGAEYCAESQKVTRTMATRGGLRLGLSEPETESILGIPTYVEGNKRWYEFKAHRLVHTEMPDEIQDWEITGIIILTFSEHRLTYLAVSRSEVF